MAQIEEDLKRQPKTKGNFQATPFLPRKPIPNIGLERLDGERYYTKEFMDAEWENIWTKTWQIVCRETDLPNIGSFYTYELGRESFLFVRGEDEKIRGFYNNCQHRGNILCQAEIGEVDTFTCPFHGWQWNIDGTIKKVADPQFFRQFADGVPEDELGLQPVRVDFWGGWVWFNMNEKATSLKDYLGEEGVHLETYDYEDYQLVDYQTFVWGGNWKHAVDAFNESYHFTSLHPDMVQCQEGHDVPIELLGIHTRMLNFNGTVSEVVEDRDTITEHAARMLKASFDIEAESYTGSAKDIHLEVVKHKRAIQDDTFQPYKKMNDEQLVHQYHYTFFPNATFTQIAEAAVMFRYRPHPTDPGLMYYDFFILIRNPPGTPEPEYEHNVHTHGDNEHYANAFGEGTWDPSLAKILREDGSNMETIQRGVQSRSFKGMLLCDQEVRLRHFHQVVDKLISGEYSLDEDADNLAPSWGLVKGRPDL